MNTKNELPNGISLTNNSNGNNSGNSSSGTGTVNFHAHLSQQHLSHAHNHLHPQHPHQHPNHQHHLTSSSTSQNGHINGTQTSTGKQLAQSMAAAIALNQYGQHTQLTNGNGNNTNNNGSLSHNNSNSSSNNLYISNNNNNNNSNILVNNSSSSSNTLMNSNSLNNSSSNHSHHHHQHQHQHHSHGHNHHHHHQHNQSTSTFGNNININSNNSNSNNGNNNSNSNEDYMYRSYNQFMQPQWYDIDIKGMVKNISPKLWQWTHLNRLCLNDNNLVRLPPVVSNLANLHYLDVSNNKIRTLPAEIGDMTSLRELYLNFNQLRVLPFELGKLFKLQQLGLKGNPLTSDIMQIYSEPNGTQKLLISLLDQLSITCSPPPRRPWMILAEPNPALNSCIFTTMCYNVLCDKYATRQYYGYCPAWALAWDYRKKLILDDIRNFNADIIALQELETEQFYQYFLPELKQIDYDGIFSPKSRAKTMSESEKKHVDGCAIFFKTTRFQLVKDYLIEFNQIAMATAEGSEDMLNRVMTKDNIGLAALLEIKQDDDSLSKKDSDTRNSAAGSVSTSNTTGSTSTSSSSTSGSATANKQMLLVSTAHIHWDPEYCDVKLIQTLMFTNELKLIIEQATREFQPAKFVNNPNQGVDCSTSIPVVVCADLNSLPESGVIEYLRTGRILANHVDFKELGYDSCLQKINTSDKPSELSHNLKLDCAYDKELMPYTNYTYDFKGMIDYIFYSSQLLRTVGLLGPLDIDWLKANKIVGFPHPHVPSDHLPLMVELELINPNHHSSQSNNQSSSFYQQSSSSGALNTNGSNNNYSNSSSSGNYQSSSSGNNLLNRNNNNTNLQSQHQHHQHHSHHSHHSNGSSSGLHHHHNHHHGQTASSSSSQSSLSTGNTNTSLSNHQNSMQSNQSSSPSTNTTTNANLMQINSSSNLLNSNSNFNNYLRK